MQPIAWKILKWKTPKIMQMSFWYGKWSWEAVVWRFPTELSIDDTFHRCITIEMISGLIKIEFLNFKTCLSHCSTSIIRKLSFYDNQYLRLRFRAIMVNRSVCSFLLPFCSLCEIVVLSWIPWIVVINNEIRCYRLMYPRYSVYCFSHLSLSTRHSHTIVSISNSNNVNTLLLLWHFIIITLRLFCHWFS